MVPPARDLGVRTAEHVLQSRTDPAVHYAFYEFVDLERAQAVLASPELQAMVAEFDRAWGPRVTRTRDILEAAGMVELNPA